VSNQPQYNMLWRVIEAEVVPLCEKEGIGQLVFSPIAQGALTGKYLPGAAPPADSRATDPSGSGFISRWLNDETLTAVQRLAPLADEAGLSLAQLAVAWTLQNANVSAAIIGATRPQQVRENVKASGVKLDSGLMSRIDEALGGVIERDPARTASPPSRSLALRAVSSPGRQFSGCRLIGPYSVLESSSSVTWSTPAASNARQFSPSQLSASPWLAKMASCSSSAPIGVPSAFSYRQVQGIGTRASSSRADHACVHRG
jgi:hypothetical protein